MPHDLFLNRLIHSATRRPFPGERLWTSALLLQPATVGFLRIRNCEGCDVYIHPYAENQNSGYILLDLDRATPSVLGTMRADGHEPCVVLQTSPGHLQAWIRVSVLPLQPAVATAIGKHLARTHHDLWADTRLAGESAAGEDEDEVEDSLEKYIADLDIALFLSSNRWIRRLKRSRPLWTRFSRTPSGNGHLHI